MKITSYKELIAYKKAYELVKVVYDITANFPQEERYGLLAQIRRSAVSIPSNIAEGYMRGSREYIQFLKIAWGSCAELETQLSLSKDLSLCNKTQYEKANGLLQEVMKLIRTYINKLAASR